MGKSNLENWYSNGDSFKGYTHIEMPDGKLKIKTWGFVSLGDFATWCQENKIEFKNLSKFSK